MQPYWVFDEPIAPKQWRYLQNLLIEVMKADKSNKNPSRVFRLAGGWHVKPDREPQKTEIVGESGIRYNFMDLQLRLVDLLVADTSRTLHQKLLPPCSPNFCHEPPALRRKWRNPLSTILRVRPPGTKTSLSLCRSPSQYLVLWANQKCFSMVWRASAILQWQP